MVGTFYARPNPNAKNFVEVGSNIQPDSVVCIIEAMKIMNEIETSGKLKFTGLISNSHLIEQTTAAEVLHGLNLTRQVSATTGLPVAFVSAVESVVRQLDHKTVPYPVLAIDRSLLKPWERSASA